MDENTQPVSDSTLDRVFAEAAADLEQAWKRRLIRRLLRDADSGDDDELRYLAAASMRPCQEHVT
ncbi:hypothetical protein HNR25_005169 [Streptomonospora salina]|uniref:Uncharacterized protein n=1 Tax=Streptomonospora salina TaxID=104205 RepID=A0A841EKM6_9ACTN|nr:hypothetical protein [Streptomonospora salina]MBB6001338.1 hypothetical protein [Streptomonospora salina]